MELLLPDSAAANWQLYARTKCCVVNRDGCGGKKLFLVSWAKLVACRKSATLDLEIAAQDVPGTTPNIVLNFFVLTPAVILRHFCLTKPKGNKPFECAIHVSWKLGLLNCHQLQSLLLCPCQATSMMLQRLHWGKVMVGSGILICWRVEKLQQGMGDLPPIVWTSQQSGTSSGSSRKGLFFFFLGLNSYFIVLETVFLTFCSSLFGQGFPGWRGSFHSTPVTTVTYSHQPCFASALAFPAGCSSILTTALSCKSRMAGNLWTAKIVLQWPAGLHWGKCRLGHSEKLLTLSSTQQPQMFPDVQLAGNYDLSWWAQCREILDRCVSYASALM